MRRRQLSSPDAAVATRAAADRAIGDVSPDEVLSLRRHASTAVEDPLALNDFRLWVPEVLPVVALEFVQQRLDELLAVVVRHRAPRAVVVLEEVRLLAVDAYRHVDGVAAELPATALALRPAFDPVWHAALRLHRRRRRRAGRFHRLLRHGSTSIFGRALTPSRSRCCALPDYSMVRRDSKLRPSVPWDTRLAERRCCSLEDAGVRVRRLVRSLRTRRSPTGRRDSCPLRLAIAVVRDRPDSVLVGRPTQERGRFAAGLLLPPDMKGFTMLRTNGSVTQLSCGRARPRSVENNSRRKRGERWSGCSARCCLPFKRKPLAME
jgi:hypothetical protein